MLADKYIMRTKPYPDNFDKISFVSFIQMLWELCDAKGDSNQVLDRRVNTRKHTLLVQNISKLSPDER
jgi:hypothetical protein